MRVASHIEHVCSVGILSVANKSNGRHVYRFSCARQTEMMRSKTRDALTMVVQTWCRLQPEPEARCLPKSSQTCRCRSYCDGSDKPLICHASRTKYDTNKQQSNRVRNINILWLVSCIIFYTDEYRRVSCQINATDLCTRFWTSQKNRTSKSLIYQHLKYVRVDYSHTFSPKK